MNKLSTLLRDKEETIILKLEYKPKDLLKEVAIQVGVPDHLFSAGRMTMKFDDKNNIIIGNKTINAEQFLETQARKMVNSI